MSDNALRPWRPGWKSTEFWLAVLPMGLGSALVMLGHDQAGFLLLGGGAVKGTSYTHQRYNLKRERNRHERTQ